MNIQFVEVRTPHVYHHIYINGVEIATCCANKRTILTGEPTNFPALLEAKDQLIKAGLSSLALTDSAFRQSAGLPFLAFKVIDRVTTNPDYDRDGGDYTMYRIFQPCDGGYQVVYGTSSCLEFDQATGRFGMDTYEDPEVVTELPEGAFPIW
jgi:hypothetical protein